ncbi:hypothetical protein [Pseudomonas sp. RIT-PI-AD]|uniref:hypothetical protein n=1 Tax=Pseudomonas sp. RIT-PI-AD TaxID=3035294 RepID=UPI0021D86F6B|nr:hypothetical protein [Pseudomonas sp. RIT-PI-AD]
MASSDTPQESINLQGLDRFRRTKSIVSELGDPEVEADVIMTSVALGFSAEYIKQTGNTIQFDIDPLDASLHPGKKIAFEAVVKKISHAIVKYLSAAVDQSSKVTAGLSPGYYPGAVIMGVYKLAGKQAPAFVSAPALSKEGQQLWERIRTLSTPQYTGRGAYTGFVDNKNVQGDTRPVGPLSTARFCVPRKRGIDPKPHPRWLPAPSSHLWNKRKRADSNTLVPWGLIGGEEAGKLLRETGCGALNGADFVTISMRNAGMHFVDDIGTEDIAIYTHGMIQAIYKSYSLGPNCEPYEIAVGDVTKKMSSCLACTLFMTATGYPPNSIHLGRCESWGPLYSPYDPTGNADPHEAQVIRDLNNTWYEKCSVWLDIGLDILGGNITENHLDGFEAVRKYLLAYKHDPTVSATLILDSMTIHASESERIERTIK